MDRVRKMPYDIAVNWAVRTVVVFLLVLSLVETILCVLPAANNLYWPAVAVAMELWPWFIVINTLGLLLIRLKSKAIAAVFGLGLVVSVWPLLLVSSATARIEAQWQEQHISIGNVPHPGQLFVRSFTHLRVPMIAPKQLPDGILLYRSSDVPLSQPAPTVVNIHGGGWHYGSPADDHTFSSYLADQGYAVFSIPYRFAPEFTFPTQIDDVRRAIAWIHANANEYGADPAHIVLMGRSAGGNLALLAGYTSDDVPISGIISFYPATDLREMYRDPPKPDPHNVPLTIAEYLGGTPNQIAETYALASPITFLKAGLPPTLQLQGMRDKIQKPRFPRELHSGLIEKGNVSILVELPWSHHSFDFVYFCSGGQLALHYVEEFLAETVGQK